MSEKVARGLCCFRFLYLFTLPWLSLPLHCSVKKSFALSSNSIKFSRSAFRAESKIFAGANSLKSALQHSKVCFSLYSTAYLSEGTSEESFFVKLRLKRRLWSAVIVWRSEKWKRVLSRSRSASKAWEEPRRIRCRAVRRLFSALQVLQQSSVQQLNSKLHQK